jgi:hypothetical protein
MVKKIWLMLVFQKQFGLASFQNSGLVFKMIFFQFLCNIIVAILIFAFNY